MTCLKTSRLTAWKLNYRQLPTTTGEIQEVIVLRDDGRNPQTKELLAN
jgi:hypothetical protein